MEIQYTSQVIHLWFIHGFCRGVCRLATLTRFILLPFLTIHLCFLLLKLVEFFLPPLGLLEIFLHHHPLCIDTVRIRVYFSVCGSCKILESHPLSPRTCHHFVPPTTRRVISSPPRASINNVAASSQHDIGTRTRTECVHGELGVRVFENSCNSSTVCLDNEHNL